MVSVSRCNRDDEIDVPCVSICATFSTSLPICLELTASGTRLVMRMRNLAANAIFKWVYRFADHCD